jgi:hypothetical protein
MRLAGRRNPQPSRSLDWSRQSRGVISHWFNWWRCPGLNGGPAAYELYRDAPLSPETA